MTNNSILKAKKDLNAIISNLALKDYNQFNKKTDGSYYKIHRPYTLSAETLEAMEILKLTNQKEIMTEDETKIKAYLLPIRTQRTELLKNTDQRI